MAKLTDRETELKEAKATLEHLDGLSVEFEGKGSDLAGWLAEVQEIVAGPGEDDRPGQPSEEPAGAQASAHDPDRGHARRRRHLVVRLHGRLGRDARRADRRVLPTSRGRAAVRCKEQRVLLHRQPPCLNGVPPG